jgi:hypothetical protein
MSPEASSADLESVPGVGPRTAADLRTIGIFSVDDLKGRDPEQLYYELIARTGCHVDRCMLYVFRCAVYYASSTERDPEKLKWWYWKDKSDHRTGPAAVKYPAVAACGLSCRLCPRFYGDGKTRCDGGGCKSPGGMGAVCQMAACALRKGIEFCGDCGERKACARWRHKINFSRQHDSFVCYRRLEDNVAFIAEHGIEAFDREQQRRGRLLARMLAGYNDGRSKEFFCAAATVLEPEELEQALAQVEASTAGQVMKERAKAMRRALEEIARKKEYDLALRK